MASWKKVIVSGSQAHLQGITASNLTNNTAVPTGQIVGYDPTTGVLSYFNTSSIVTPNAFVQGGNSFGATAVLGTNDNQNLQFETSGSVAMTISSSGAIGIGTATPTSGLLQLNSTATSPHANIYVFGGNAQTGSITVRANNGFTANLKLYDPVGGSDSLNFIQLLDSDTAVGNNQPLGRIIFSSLDTDTTGSGTTKAFIEAVSEDTTPDAFLAFGTNQSGSLVTERMRITSVGNVVIGITSSNARLHVSGANNASLLQLSSPSASSALFVSGSGNVGIGTATPTNTLQVGGTGISTTNLTASALPTITQAQMLGIDSSGNITKFDTSSIVAGAAAAVQTFKTISVGGVSLEADSSTDTLTIASGSFGGVATTRNNLLLSGSQDDTLTISFLDSPTFTNITASGNISCGTLTTSLGATVGGTLAANGAITTTTITASGNISSSAGLIGQTLTTSGGATVGGNVVVTGDLAVNSTGIGITAVNITASNNLLVSNNLIVNGNTTLGSEATDSVTVNAQTVTLANQLSATALSSTMLVITSSNRVATQTLGAGVATFLNTPSSANLAAAVTDKTGTGTLVFSASPTFTGTIGAAAITTTGNVVIGGDLTVNGDTTILNTSTLSIEDKFIVLGRSSGSQAPASEGGIIIEGAAGSGSAFVFNSGSGGANGLANRWGVALGVGTASINVTPIDFMVTVSSSVVSPTDSNAPTFGSSSFGYGNMHINTNDGEIWIYV